MSGKVLPSQEILRRARVRRARLVVRGLPLECWRCKREDVAVAVIHHDGYIGYQGAGLVVTDEEVSLAYARQLLQTTAHPQAATIKVRRSRTAGESYLSNGCTACDALFGAFFISERVVHVLAEDAIDTLPVLAVAEREAIEWFAPDGLGATSGSFARYFGTTTSPSRMRTALQTEEHRSWSGRSIATGRCGGWNPEVSMTPRMRGSCR